MDFKKNQFPNSTHAVMNDWIILLFILLFSLSLRFLTMMADPPAGDLSRSAAFLADEGTWAINAMEWALTGDWYIPNAYNPGAIVPIFMLFEYFIFKLGGVNLAALRLGFIFISLCSQILLYIILKNNSKKNSSYCAHLTVLFSAIAFPLVIFNRLAFLENVQIFFMLLTVYSLLKYLKFSKFLWLAATYLSFFLGFLTKPSMIFFLGLIIIMAIVLKPHKLKVFILYSLSFLMPFSIFLWFWYNTYIGDWTFFTQSIVGPRLSTVPTIMSSFFKTIAHLKFFEFMPIMYGLALIKLFQNLNAFMRDRQSVSHVQSLLSLWFILGILYVGFSSYSPPRYSLVLLPAICGLAASFFSGTIQKISLFQFIILIGIISFQCVFGLYRLIVLDNLFPSVFLPWLALFAVLFIYSANRGPIRYHWLKSALFLSIAIVSSLQIIHYYSTATFSMLSAMKTVKQQVAKDGYENPVIAGDSGPIMALYAGVRTVDIMFRQENLETLVQERKPQYLFLEDPRELKRLKLQVPGYWDKIELLSSQPLLNNYIHGQNSVFYKITQ
ncbi:hypothetical protein GF406_18270 [candidate division KSB1 bacterium]|nr:hypothetical protein [candidate division KSB1 bacterium]